MKQASQKYEPLKCQVGMKLLQHPNKIDRHECAST
jgi:hypothetical protein